MRFALLFLALAATIASAQASPPLHHITLSVAAHEQLDSLALDARLTRIENAACLTHYSVHGDTLVVAAFGAASMGARDSVSIQTKNGEPICPDGIPGIHSHVAYQGMSGPSETDYATEKLRGIWNLLLQVRENGWLIFVY